MIRTAALPLESRKVDLWDDYAKLPAPAHAVVASMLAHHVIETDPELFARFAAEARAIA